MPNAIVFGATSGIGKELAKILVNNDYKVGVTGRREANLLELKKKNTDKYFISSFDATAVNNSEKLTKLAKEIGDIDLLILSSGTGDLNEKLDFEIEDRTNRLNVVAFTEIVDWAFNYFKKQGYGHLIAISSIAGLRGSRIAPAYNASKAYQINYLEGLRLKAIKTSKPIYVTDIRPGLVDTDMAKGDGHFWVATKEKVAKQIFNIIKQKKGIGYVTKRWTLIAWIVKIVPLWFLKKVS